MDSPIQCPEHHREVDILKPDQLMLRTMRMHSVRWAYLNSLLILSSHIHSMVLEDIHIGTDFLRTTTSPP